MEKRRNFKEVFVPYAMGNGKTHLTYNEINKIKEPTWHWVKKMRASEIVFTECGLKSDSFENGRKLVGSDWIKLVNCSECLKKYEIEKKNSISH